VGADIKSEIEGETGITPEPIEDTKENPIGEGKSN